MIRRDIRLPDGSPGWMLISQVEHAHISAKLASHCAGRFAVDSDNAARPPTPPEVRAEVLAAILHHDDGWAEWEKAPQVDPATGRPLAFTELVHTDALAIWLRSIDAAAAIGPLAAWMVAGHFLRLAAKSDASRGDSAIQSWGAHMSSRRGEWLDQWQSLDPKHHTRELADEALQWLWTFDEASLWLCCTSNLDQPIPSAPEPYLVGRGASIETELLARGPELAVARPWRFDRENLELTIRGLQLPAIAYGNSADLQAAGRPAGLFWRLSREK